MRRTLLSLAAFLAFAAAAHAATYGQHLCQLPNGDPAPADGIVGVKAGTGTSTTNRCLAGGPLAATVPGTSQSETYADLVYHAPQNTSITGVVVDRATAGIAQPGNITYAFLQKGYSCDPGKTLCDRCVPDAGCESGLARESRSWGGEVFPALDFQVTCPESGCQGVESTASINLFSLVVDLDDSALPQVTAPPTDGLFSTDHALSGEQPISYTATDKGGGIAAAAIEVDGAQADKWVPDDNGGKCVEPFVYRVPCKLSVTDSHTFDTRLLTNGAHRVVLKVYDATGVNYAAAGPVDVVVDNGPPGGGGGSGGGSGGGGSGGGSGGSGVADSGSGDGSAGTAPAMPTAPALGVGPSLAARIVPGEEVGDGEVLARFGKPVTISGVLVDDRRRPIPNAKLLVTATPDAPGERPVVIGTVTTTATGAFAYTAPAGPSRQITVSYRPFGAGTAPAATLGTHVLVPAAVRLWPSSRHTHNGKTLTLTAHVLGEKSRRGYAKVAFQVLIGHTWRTFARDGADGRGYARATHHFHLTFTAVRYRFRALTLAARGFPYAIGHSKTVSVLVRP